MGSTDLGKARLRGLGGLRGHEATTGEEGGAAILLAGVHLKN